MTDAQSATGVDGRRCRAAARATRRAAARRRPRRVFAELGYHEASIVKITEAAGVAQGTFYLYFASKKEIFDELVRDLNRRVRHAMTEAPSRARTRVEAELLGFAAYFRFTAEHPALYRIIRQAEFVSPEMLQLPLRARSPSGYVAALREAMDDAARSAQADPEVLAWALMGIGELLGMRWILWDGRRRVPATACGELERIIARRRLRGAGRVTTRRARRARRRTCRSAG